MANEFFENRLNITRKHFLGKLSLGLGSVALGSLLVKDLFSSGSSEMLPACSGFHILRPKQNASFIFFKRSAITIRKLRLQTNIDRKNGEDLPASVRMGQRLTGMTANQDKFPMVGSKFKFNQYGESGTWISELVSQHWKNCR
jgi:hypothetical protein